MLRHFWDRPDKDGMKGKRPISLGQLIEKSRREKPVAVWITATSLGLVGQEIRDKEAKWVERNEGQRREPFL
jgi:hypothetical protein